ncbi:MAG: hypothetical protein Q6J68_06645 [Thermostichales cyanobacterium SZTDM-1c_bins_54]
MPRDPWSLGLTTFLAWGSLTPVYAQAFTPTDILTLDLGNLPGATPSLVVVPDPPQVIIEIRGTQGRMPDYQFNLQAQSLFQSVKTEQVDRHTLRLIATLSRWPSQAPELKQIFNRVWVLRAGPEVLAPVAPPALAAPPPPIPGFDLNTSQVQPLPGGAVPLNLQLPTPAATPLPSPPPPIPPPPIPSLEPAPPPLPILTPPAPDLSISQSAQDLQVQAPPPPPPQLSLDAQVGLKVTSDQGVAGRLGTVTRYTLGSNTILGLDVDIIGGSLFGPSGIDVKQLFIAQSIPGLENLRFLAGKLDLTAAFDRNSFAKDNLTHFFNFNFGTNPALVAGGLGAKPAFLVDWLVTDDLAVKVAPFASQFVGDVFQFDSLAGEVAFRFQENYVTRLTFVTGRDTGVSTFRENDRLLRPVIPGDRVTAFGLNGEAFFPEIRLGAFFRYGYYRSEVTGVDADHFSLGVNLLDLFRPQDRLGIGYARALSNYNFLLPGERTPDVLEVFYDLKVRDNIRVGFSAQAQDGFSRGVFGVRTKIDFPLLPRP